MLVFIRVLYFYVFIFLVRFSMIAPHPRGSMAEGEMGAPHTSNLCVAVRRLRMEEVLTAALSPDNAVRRRAEDQLSYANGQRGFAVALAKKLFTTTTSAASSATSLSIAGAASGMDGALSSPDSMDTPTRLMAGMLLQKFIRDRWSRSDSALLPPEDKAQVSSVKSHNKSPFSCFIIRLFLGAPDLLLFFLVYSCTRMHSYVRLGKNKQERRKGCTDDSRRQNLIIKSATNNFVFSRSCDRLNEPQRINHQDTKEGERA